MSDIFITVVCGDKQVNLDVTSKLDKYAYSLTNSIEKRFGVEVEYYQVLRDGMSRYVDVDCTTTLKDFGFLNGDILCVNNPHAKARPCDMVGKTHVVFHFEGVSARVEVLKENSIMHLYKLIYEEATFEDNFCLKYEGAILDRHSPLTIFQSGIKKGGVIEICGRVIV